jgi:glycerol-3-phosphate dehydrogenase
MKRDVVALSRGRFDILVVGGGIHGALVAWDAVLRGLSVALIDRGDFGGATSQNSLKIIHGGLRYLQDGNIGRVRTMASERSTWMKIAPHLVHPLSCLLPTYPTLSRSRLALSIALKINDFLGNSHNNLQDPGKQLNNSRVISLEEFKRFLPEIELKEQTGAALWQDAMMYSSERLLLSFILSAERLGAINANYVEAVEILYHDLTVSGVRARDLLTGQEFDIQSQIVINATGAWIDELRTFHQKQNNPGRFSPSIAMNLVTRQLWPDCAAGLPNTPGSSKRDGTLSKHSQIFFFVPWREYTLIGTWHFPWHASPGSFRVTEEIIQQFIENINWVDPNIHLSLEDILHVHWGFLPIQPHNNPKGQMKLVRDGRVVDHQIEDGIAGYITLVGVKYTTARVVAQQAVDLAVRKLDKVMKPCQTQAIPVWGGDIDLFNDFLTQALNWSSHLIEQDTIEHLVYTYGSAYQCILQYLDQEPWLGEKIDPTSPVIKAEVVHAVRHEMAQTLRDVVQRRTELGAAGLPEPSTLQACADLMGSELGWDESTKSKSIEEVVEAYPLFLKERAGG